MRVNKVVYDGEVLIDISDSTVDTPSLKKGEVAYNAKGERIVGTMETGGGNPVRIATGYVIGDSSGNLINIDAGISNVRAFGLYPLANGVIGSGSERCIYSINYVYMIESPDGMYYANCIYQDRNYMMFALEVPINGLNDGHIQIEPDSGVFLLSEQPYFWYAVGYNR